MSPDERYRRIHGALEEHGVSLPDGDLAELALLWHDIASRTWAQQADGWIRTRLLQLGVPDDGIGPTFKEQRYAE